MSKRNKQRVLAIVAHADDEVYGCGGTLARHVSEGDVVDILVIADGVSSRLTSDPDSKSLMIRHDEAERAATVLGTNLPRLLDFPDNRLDSLDRLDIIKRIEEEIEQLRPTVIYTHHAGDVNIDHRIVHDAVIVATRPVPGSLLKQLYFFEVPSSSEWRPSTSMLPFSPNYYVDITKTIETKINAIGCYASEVRDFPHPRSIEACRHLAGWRGASAGVVAAEAFEVGRFIR